MVEALVYSCAKHPCIWRISVTSAFRWVFDLRIFAAMVDQWAALTSAERLDMADDDTVVAAREDVDNAAVYPAERVVEYRRACGGGMRGGVAEVAARGRMSGEALAQIELVLAEYIHGKVAIAQHHLMQIGCLLDADEDEW